MKPLLLPALALLFVGCPAARPATEIVVELDAAPGVRADARSVSIAVAGGPVGALVVRHTETLAAPIDWPVTVAIVPETGDASRRFSVTATALDGAGGDVARVHALSGFVAGETRVLRLFLEDCCRGVACDGDETCRSCTCASAEVDPTTLPLYPATADGGTSIRDGGADDAPLRTDGGGDAGTNDAGPLDAGPPDCTDTSECGPDQVCESEHCVLRCDATHDDCNDDPSDGCEADLRSLEHCGSCRVPCAVTHGTPSCATGACVIEACDGAYRDCDGVVSTGCEAATDIDPANCGGCAMRCDAPSATVACVASACTVVACAPGTGNCDGAATSGCETDTTSSFDHCGTCGTGCALRGTNRTCAGSSCTTLGCMAGFVDCNGVAADGCESYRLSDRNNCGACGVVCPGGQNCDNGGCCPLGLGFCPGAGCVDTSSDENHCGGCGRFCAGTCFDYDCI